MRVLEVIDGYSFGGIAKVIEDLSNNPTELEDLVKIQNKINKLKTVNIPPERLSQPIFSEIDNSIEEIRLTDTPTPTPIKTDNNIIFLQPIKKIRVFG